MVVVVEFPEWVVVVVVTRTTTAFRRTGLTITVPVAPLLVGDIVMVVVVFAEAVMFIVMVTHGVYGAEDELVEVIEIDPYVEFNVDVELSQGGVLMSVVELGSNELDDVELSQGGELMPVEELDSNELDPDVELSQGGEPMSGEELDPDEEVVSDDEAGWDVELELVMELTSDVELFPGSALYPVRTTTVSVESDSAGCNVIEDVPVPV